jgi:hypothetical protein
MIFNKLCKNIIDVDIDVFLKIYTKVIIINNLVILYNFDIFYSYTSRIPISQINYTKT